MSFHDAVRNLYLQGRFDSDRYDAVPNCKPGNKPCGRICIPQKYECNLKGGGKKTPQGSSSDTRIRDGRIKAAALLATAAGVGVGSHVLADNISKNTNKDGRGEKRSSTVRKNEKTDQIEESPSKGHTPKGDKSTSEEIRDLERKIDEMQRYIDDDDDNPNGKRKKKGK